MATIKYFIYVFLLVLNCKFHFSLTINEKLVVKKVERTIDVSSQLAKIALDVTLENTGTESCNNFLLAVDSKLSDHLAFAGASVRLNFFSSVLQFSSLSRTTVRTTTKVTCQKTTFIVIVDCNHSLIIVLC